MQCALRRTSRKSEKVADGGSTMSRKFLGQNGRKIYTKEPEVSASFFFRNSEQRFFIVTFVTVEVDAPWKFLAPVVLSLQGPEHRNSLGSEAEVKMDGLEPVSLPPVILHIDPRRADGSENCTSSAKSSTASCSSEADVMSGNRGSVNKRTKAAMASAGCCHLTYNGSNDSSGSVCDGSIANGSTDLVKDATKTDKRMKRSSKKKVKKKGKQHKKHLSRAIGVTAACDESINSTSVLDTGVDKDSAYVNGHTSENEETTDVPFRKASREKLDNEDSSNDVLNFSTATTATTSCSDEGDEFETSASLPKDFTANANMIHSTEKALSSFGGENINNAHMKQSSDRDDFCSGNLTDGYNTSTFDSLSDGCNSDGSTNGNDDARIQSSVKRENRIDTSDSGMTYRNYGASLNGVTAVEGCFAAGTSSDLSNQIIDSNSQWCKVVVNADNKTDRTKCNSEGCSSGDIQSLIPTKRGRQHRKSPHGVNMQGSVGKGSHLSIWQKVPKSDVDECICDPKNVNPFCSQFDALKEVSSCATQDTFMALRKNECKKSIRPACLDEISAQIQTLERLSNGIDSEVSSLKSDDDSSWKKVSGKSKKKASSGSKQEHNCSSRKGPYSSKSNLARSTRMNQQKESSEISSLGNYQKSAVTETRSHSHTDRRRVGVPPADRDNFFPSETLPNSKTHVRKMKPLDNVRTMVSDARAQTMQNQISPLPGALDTMEETSQLQADSNGISEFLEDFPGDPCLAMGNEGKGPVKLENEVPHAEHYKQDRNIGSILQKWIPVERKDAELLKTNGDGNLPASHLDAPVIDSLRNIEKSSLNSHSRVSLADTGATCLGPGSAIVDSTPIDEGQLDSLRSHTPSTPTEHGIMHVTSNSHSTHKSTEQSISVIETDSDKIPQVVTNAYRLQIESEGVQLATGSPLAEFERLLHAASPVLDETYIVQCCNICSGDHVIGDSLCRHQIPNTSLGGVWQWYERPGSYGLEVKAEEYHNSKNLDSDRFRFRAYFVPFLSAVQLFGHSRSSTCTSRDTLNAELVKTCHVNVGVENSSNLSRLPIFSMLLPQPRREESKSSSLHVNSMNNSVTSSAFGHSEALRPSIGSANICDADLLFEYFESEQPQQRRPLFEKIKELVRGNSTSSCQVFGDPSKLDSMPLHDLHPASWYSVAWYPIYRIPDGNFRAAFLTYHSLSHFIRRNTSSDFLSGDTCIVSPVVGLQSYNAQGECWFQLRNSTVIQADVAPCLSPSGILKERLRTLEQTASTMARASVCKGDRKSVNRQPDYEFFLSRRR